MLAVSAGTDIGGGRLGQKGEWTGSCWLYLHASELGLSGQEKRTFQHKDFRGRIDYCTVCCDWPREDTMRISKVDDDNLVLLADRFSHADEVVGFKSQ